MFKKRPIEEVDDFLRISLAAKNEVIAAKNSEIEAWKDRGNRYAAHNDELQKNLYELNSMLLKMLKDPPNDASAYKQLLELAIKKVPK